MYLWIGLGVCKDDENAIRSFCISANRGKVSEVAFSLPQHISLKTSFETDRYHDIIAFLKEIYRHQDSFCTEIDGIRQLGDIIWIKIKETEFLRAMHEHLNTILMESFGVGLTGYNGDTFTFHSTLFMDPGKTEDIDRLFTVLSKNSFPRKILTVDKMYFGVSPDGTAGSFRVIDRLDF